MKRTASVVRETNETNIIVCLDLDGTGKSEIVTGIPFLDHMLEQIATHGVFDLKIKAKGDIEIDTHHTVEDIAITLGQAVNEALKEKKGIVRMAHCYAPMDEALTLVALDISGRPYCQSTIPWSGSYLGPSEKLSIPVTQIEHFFYSLAMNANISLHIAVQYGRDDHHMCESIFKGFARALDKATRLDSKRKESLPSSKGVL